MSKILHSRIAKGLLSVLVAGGMFLTVPEPTRAREAGCGENSGKECSSTTTCYAILIFNSCTTVTKYYPEEE